MSIYSCNIVSQRVSDSESEMPDSSHVPDKKVSGFMISEIDNSKGVGSPSREVQSSRSSDRSDGSLNKLKPRKNV